MHRGESSSSIRAARLVRHGTPLEVTDVDIAPAAHGTVRVEIAYAGVNPVDRYTVQGSVAPDAALRRTLGGEASGTLDGRPVVVAGAGLGASRDGVWATAALVPEEAVIDIPDGVDMQQAAAVGVVGLTAWNVTQLAGVTSDDRVLVLGASGGVGLPLLSLLASLGATVWGQTGSESKATAITAAGAGRSIVGGPDDVAIAAAELEPTVVFDSLGSAFTPAALGKLAPGGRMVVFGTSAGPNVGLDLRGLYRSSQRILGYGGIRLPEDQRRAGIADALAAIAEGRMRIPVGRVFPLEEVNDALAAIADRAVTGKVLLRP